MAAPTARSRVPRYLEIADSIRSDIKRGVYHGKGALPPLGELAKAYDVSRLTVREAVTVLENEALVETRQGIGTLLTTRARRQTTEPVDAEENFAAWKDLVRLPDSFPTLEPLKWDELDEEKKLYLRPAQATVVKQIKRTAQGHARPHAAVVVSGGHGCTTLFNFIYGQLSRNVPITGEGTHLVPVRITWGRLGTDVDEFSDNLQAAMREDIMRELANDGWPDIVHEVTYARLLGALGDGDEDVDVDTHLEELKSLTNQTVPIVAEPPKKPARELRKLAPLIFKSPLPKLIEELHHAGIKTLLMIDLSSGDWPVAERETPIDDVVGVIKDLHDQLPEHGARRALLSEMYFMSEPMLGRVTAVFARQLHPIRFPHYTQADVFGILTRHYPAVFDVHAEDGKVKNFKSFDLPAVVPSQLLSHVELKLARRSETFGDVGLNEIIEMFRQVMLETMDGPWSRMTYHLPPAGD